LCTGYNEGKERRREMRTVQDICDLLSSYYGNIPLDVAELYELVEAKLNDLKKYKNVDLDTIKVVCRYRGKIQAIKLVRALTNCDLRGAKDYVDLHCTKEYDEWREKNCTTIPKKVETVDTKTDYNCPDCNLSMSSREKDWYGRCTYCWEKME
jgi:ribosomal protein L7/L12